MAMNYVGWKIRAQSADYFLDPSDGPVEFQVIAARAGACDFCMDGIAAYEVDAESVLGDGAQNVFYCQPCAESAAAAADNPDRWIPLERLYVVCRQCGEAFDDLQIAFTEHKPGHCGSDQGWDIVTESEAF